MTTTKKRLPRRTLTAKQVKKLKGTATTASLVGGGAVGPAQGLGCEIDGEDEECLTKAATPSLRDALSAPALAKLEKPHLHALHGEAHDAWESVRNGAESWTPRNLGSRAGRREDFRGLKVMVEHDRGDVRTGVGKDGKEWSRVMTWPYGYVVGSVGLDGEPVDVYLGPNADAPDAYVVHQARNLGPGEIGGYDEDKVMLGFAGEHAAREAYHAHMPDARFLGGVTKVPFDEFRAGVMDGKKKSWGPVAKALAARPLPPSAFIASLAAGFPSHDTYVEHYATDGAALDGKCVADVEILCTADDVAATKLRARKATEERMKSVRVLKGSDFAANFDGQQSLHFVDARSRDINRANLLKLVSQLRGKWMMVCSSANPIADVLRDDGAHVKYAQVDGEKPTWLAVVSNAPLPESDRLQDAPTEKANPPCRRKGESKDDCVSRKIPVTSRDAVNHAQAIAIAESECGKPCAEKSVGDEPCCDDCAEDDIAKQIFSSNSSKRTVADKLASVLPEHSVYVEPFVGSASVFFAKKAAKNYEVLSDLDANIARAYRAIKGLTPAALTRLEKMDWRGSKSTLRKLHGEKPRDEIGFLHKFLYQKRFSIFGFPTAFRVGAEGTVAKVVDKIRKHAARLRQAKVMQGDYEDVAKQHDGEDTLHFFDPPYKGRNAAVGENKFDDERFFNVVRALKGKVAITIDAYSPLAKRFADEGYNVRYFAQKRKIANWRPKLGSDLWQALVTNYPLPEAEWLQSVPPMQPAVEKARGGMNPDEVSAAHANIAMELVRRGMPHDSLLPPLFPDREEDTHEEDHYPDDTGETLAKAVAKRADLPEERVQEWIDNDAEAALASADDFPEMEEGLGGDVAIATVESGLDSPEAPHIAWDPEATTKCAAHHTLLMFRKGEDALWKSVRVAPPFVPAGEQAHGSGLLAAHKGVFKALVDARLSPVTSPTEKLWQSDDGTWSRVRVVGKGRWVAGRQSDAWREFTLTDVPVAGRWVLQKVIAADGSATLLRHVTAAQVEKRAVMKIEAEFIDITKREEEKVVTGVVLQPEVTDAQGDIYNAAVIKKAAYNFLAKYGQPGGTTLGFMHRDFSKPFELVESWIAPEDTTIGGRKILKGSWLMSVRVLDEKVWRGIKEKRFKGFSIGGVAKVQRLSAA